MDSAMRERMGGFTIMANQLTISDVFARLGVPLPLNTMPADIHVAPVPQTYGSPWYLRLFAGIGAWIAAILFLVFLGIVGLLENEFTLLVVGSLLLAGAIWLQRRGSRNDFVQQLALSGSLLAQAMMTFGIGQIFDQITLTALAVIGLEIMLLWLYNDHFHRFVSTLIIVGAILAIIFGDIEQPNLIHAVILGLATVTTLISVFEPRLMLRRTWSTITAVHDGVTIAMLGLLLLTLPFEFDIGWWWLSAIGLMGLLLFAGGRIVTQLDVHLELRQIAVITVLLLGLTAMSIKIPGLAGALLIIMLGFWRRNWLFTSIAMAFGLVYLFNYYFSLELTLMTKSLIMISTGGILLLMRWLNQNREQRT